MRINPYQTLVFEHQSLALPQLELQQHDDVGEDEPVRGGLGVVVEAGAVLRPEGRVRAEPAGQNLGKGRGEISRS